MPDTTTPIIKKIIKRFHDSTGAKRRHTDISRKWFREQLTRNFQRVRKPQVISGIRSKDLLEIPPIGAMVMYVYDAEHKKTLPYWDAFPLVLPLEIQDSNHFLGLSLHYLPPVIRGKLLVELLKNRTRKNYNPNTRFAIDYATIMKYSNNKWIRHGIKQYRFTNVRSKFIRVEPKVWEILIFLPTARFQGASNKKVWSDA